MRGSGKIDRSIVQEGTCAACRSFLFLAAAPPRAYGAHRREPLRLAAEFQLGLRSSVCSFNLASGAVSMALQRTSAKDEEGRDSFSYLEGTVPVGSLEWFEDAVLIAAARLISGYHAATAEFIVKVIAPAGLRWSCVTTVSHRATRCFPAASPVALIDFRR
jgi:hypothetical protein